MRGGLFVKAMSAFQSTLLLTAVSFFSQAVGFFYRVLLSRMVGAEIMGLYQLIMPASAVLMSLTAVGFTVACSNLSAQYRARGNLWAADRVVRTCILGFLCAFGVVALVAVPLSDVISVRLLGDARSQLGLLLLLPCVLLTGLENIHKHSFYGASHVGPPALTEICEQVIRTGAVLGLLWHFLPQNPERTVGLIVCGMILCEIFSALTLAFLYRRATGRHPAGETVPQDILRSKVFHIALPIALTSLLGNLMGAANAVIIPQQLVRSGQGVSESMASFGILSGMTIPLLTLPTAFISAMGLVLLPRLAQATALGRKDLCRRRATKALSAAAWLTLPTAALLAVLAPHLGRTLFREEGVGQFALPLAVIVVLSCFESVLTVCLNGLGKQALVAKDGLVCGAVQLFVTWWRVGTPGVGLRGYVEALFVSTVLGVFLHWHSLHHAIGLQFQPFAWVVAPGLSALLAGLWVNLLFPLLLRSGLGEGYSCLICLLFGALLYFCAMAAQGVVTRRPLPSPAGK